MPNHQLCLHWIISTIGELIKSTCSQCVCACHKSLLLSVTAA